MFPSDMKPTPAKPKVCKCGKPGVKHLAFRWYCAECLERAYDRFAGWVEGNDED